MTRRFRETKSERPRLGHEHERDVSPRQLIERQQRFAAAERRSITQRIFGDPPVGFSAADQPRVAPVTPTLSSGGGSSLPPRRNKS